VKDFSRTNDLHIRAKHFAIKIIKLIGRLPRTTEVKILGTQLIRSGTSVAANYRAACRARSKAEFVAKLGTVVEEADETVFWLELLVESGIVGGAQMDDLLKEASELRAIFSASRRTAKSKG
jgi:four helix bundle protein